MSVLPRTAFYDAVMPEFTITVRANPGASRARIGGTHGDPPELIVAVRETEKSGRANAAIEAAVAQEFEIPPSMVDVKSGQAGRKKVLSLFVPDMAKAEATLQRLLAAQDD
jgi:Uncharacterized conserved protein